MLYEYPYGNKNIFTGMTKQFLLRGHPYAWCLWRELQNDSTYKYKQVAQAKYVERDKVELQTEIREAFELHNISYIMPAGDFRIYMAFDTWEDTTPYFVYMMDGFSVAHKYRQINYTDSWGIL